MSDDADLTPEQEADVRRLLAEARHDDPMPEDVVSRLDRVLAQLAAGDSELDPTIVVELATRRRRLASTLLVAAAAIVAIGVGLGQVIPIGDDGDADPSSVSADAPQAEAADGAATADGLERMAVRDAPAPKSDLSVVRSSHFATDVRLVGVLANLSRMAYAAADSTVVSGGAPAQPESEQQDQGNGSGAGDSGSHSDGDGVESQPDETSGGFFRSVYACGPAAYGLGRLVPVLYDGEPAVLAFRKPTGDTRIVDLLECGTGDILRSVTLARP